MTEYSDYNPAGTTRTTKRGIARHIPLLPNYFNHQWIEDYLTDFIDRNYMENNGVISGCVISDGGSNDINTSAGEIYVDGNKVTVSAPGTFETTGDGWYISYITSAGSVIHAHIVNSTAQGAVTPSDAVIIGYSVLGNSIFQVFSFSNRPSDVPISDTLEPQEEYTWGTITQTSAGDSDFYTDASGDPLDADDNPFTIDDDSKIQIVHDAVATANILIKAGVKKINLSMKPGLTLDMDTYDLELGESGDIIGGNLRVSGSGVLTIEKPTGFTLENDTMSVVNNDGVIVGPVFDNNEFWIWGTETQVDAGNAHFYTDSDGEPLDTKDAAFTLSEDDNIRMIHDTTFTANLKLNPVSSTRLNVSMIQGVDLDFGDAGSGEPYKLIIGGNVKSGSKITLRGIQEFIDLPFALSSNQKRFISNQSVGVRIQYNEDLIYKGSNGGYHEIIQLDSWPASPYLIRMDGQQLNWMLHSTPANNNTLAWFRDLNKFLNGYRDGNEVASRFTLPAVISANPHLFQVNTPNGIFRDISTSDPDIHSRTDSNGVSISATADFTNTSSTVTFQTSIGNIKEGMRLNGASAEGIPDGTSGTTILVDIDETARTATMIDALTRIPVNATSTTSGVSVTIDNSGAAGGSLQQDTMQGHYHDDNIQYQNPDDERLGAGEFGAGASGIKTVATNVSGGVTAAITDGTNGAPRTSSETRQKNTNGYYFYPG